MFSGVLGVWIGVLAQRRGCPGVNRNDLIIQALARSETVSGLAWM